MMRVVAAGWGVVGAVGGVAEGGVWDVLSREQRCRPGDPWGAQVSQPKTSTEQPPSALFNLFQSARLAALSASKLDYYLIRQCEDVRTQMRLTDHLGPIRTWTEAASTNQRARVPNKSQMLFNSQGQWDATCSMPTSWIELWNSSNSSFKCKKCCLYRKCGISDFESEILASLAPHWSYSWDVMEAYSPEISSM